MDIFRKFFLMGILILSFCVASFQLLACKEREEVVADTPSLDLMIGQMLMLGFKATKPEDTGARNVRSLLAKGQIGGLIFMGKNMVSKPQIKKLVSFVKGSTPPSLPPFIGIDQEGGKVQRLTEKHGFTVIPTANFVASKGSYEKAFQVYKTLASELSEVGFNINFGPVVDLNLVATNPIIGGKERSYSDNADQVARFARAFVMAHRKEHILTALKHFPGHGSSWTDSHKQFVDLSKSWKESELAPYRSMIQRGLADMVMVGHLYHPDFSDGENMPASLSSRAINGQLRGKIGYQGLVITDDLGMGAIEKYIPFADTLVRAVNAGNDILLLVDGRHATAERVAKIHDIIKTGVRDGKITRKTIVQSYERIIAAKRQLGQGNDVKAALEPK